MARDLGSFVRFLSVAALFHAQTINVSEVARGVGAARMTVEGYFSVLEDTLLSWRLRAFEIRPRVRERAHPKVYWIDAGIVRSLKGSRGPTIAEERGPLVEGWVANVLRASISYGSLPIEMSYLPRQGGFSEVDFILKHGDDLVAIEVKASGAVDSRALKGLRSILDLKGLRRRILLCGVSRPELTPDGIEIWPFNSLSDNLVASNLFGA